MRLLEREAAAASLSDAVARAAGGQGGLVLVTGEAGAGKTSLLRHVAAASRLPWLWGWCDPLPTPAPLAPWRDMAEEAGLPDPAALGPDAARRALLAWLRDGPPRVLVVEDAHWADDATAAVLRHLARRMDGVPAAVVVTARDGWPVDAPVRQALARTGGGADLVRVALPPLSEGAVAELASAAGRDGAQLHGVTGGNPFLVAEALSAPPGSVPQGAVESVGARLLALGADARGLVERAAVLPGRARLDLLVPPGSPPGPVDDAVQAGLLVLDRGTVAFRHELVRLAVLERLPPMRRAALHAAALSGLEAAPGTDPASLAHHADGAHDARASARHHTAAAARAAGAGAHREAERHLLAALDRQHVLPRADVAHLYRRLSEEQHTLRGASAATDAAARAVDLLREDGTPPLVLGDALRWLARTTPDVTASRRTLEAALRLLRPLGTTAELSDAWALEATLHMLARELDRAEAAADRALAASRACGHVPGVEAALQARGCARLLRGDGRGEADLRQAVAAAVEHGLDAEAGRAWSNLVSAAGEACLYALADRAAADGLPFLLSRDLDSPASYVRAWQARCLAERGRWDQASGAVASVLDAGPAADIAVLLALCVRGRVRARRGDPDPQGPLAAALTMARTTGLLQRLAPVAAARAEARWLAGQRDDGRDGLLEAVDLARHVGHPWALGELGLQLRRHGLDLPSVVVDRAAQPYRLHLRGDLRAAAAAWDALGRPYEAADALSDGTSTDDLREALDRFTALGARPARERVARELRARGVRDLPRGPRPASRSDPHGLTPRQQEVRDLVRQGRTDPEIAAALHLSVKTVGHHVSAVLHKTGARSRREVPGPQDGDDLPTTGPAGSP